MNDCDGAIRLDWKNERRLFKLLHLDGVRHVRSRWLTNSVGLTEGVSCRAENEKQDGLNQLELQGSQQASCNELKVGNPDYLKLPVTDAADLEGLDLCLPAEAPVERHSKCFLRPV